jgi:phospholipid/cholesterol/gamma-HCH transport system substrate-binding protein
MSQMNNRKGIITGIFVLLGIAIMITGVLTLGGQKKTFVRALHVTAVFKDVNGLSQGNNVWFSGVKVGTIKHISFAPDAGVIVDMNVEDKVRRFIARDAKAKIGTDGLIGNKIVVIYGGSPTAPRIEDHGRLTVEAAFNTEDAIAMLQANNRNLLSITSDFKTITERLANGQGSLGKLLNNETMYNDLVTTMNSLKRASGNAGNITRDIESYTGKLDQNGHFAHSLVSDTLIFSRLHDIVNQVNEVAAKANSMVENLSRVSAQVGNTETPAGAVLNDKAMAADLKETIRNLNAASEKLDDNMEALQHNFLLRGFFRRKAKEEKKRIQNAEVRRGKQALENIRIEEAENRR